MTYNKNDQSNFTKKIKELIEFVCDEKKAYLSQGIWYQFNDDFINSLNESVFRIPTEYCRFADIDRKRYQKIINEKIAKAKLLEENVGKSEEDLEEWLIIYLNYRRKLESLYLNGIKVCDTKYPSMKETIKLEFIKEAITQTLEYFIQEFADNPLIALQLLLMELSDYITKTYDSNATTTIGYVNIAIIIKAFDKLLNKSLNGKNARDVIIYLINLFFALDKKHKLRKDEYIKFLRDFVLKALEKNKDYVYNILGINEDDLKL